MQPYLRNRVSFVGLVLFLAMIYVVSPCSSLADTLLNLEAEIATDEELASMRGGFTSVDGLEISFGINQAVLIDGVLQVATTFSALATAGMLPQQATGFSSVALTPEAIRSQMQTLIVQNSLDHKVIDNFTLINASVTSLGLSRRLNQLDALQQLQIGAR